MEWEESAKLACVVRLLLCWCGGRCLDVVGQPCQTLEETLTGGGAAGYDVPDLVLEL